MNPSAYTRRDFDHSPFVVFYELTQACDLVCRHCRACAQPARHPEELDERQARAVLDQLASFPKPPLTVLTGGDPLKRPDVFELVRHGVGLGLEMAMTPSATPLVTASALQQLHASGLSRLAVSLDGADAETHDSLRGVPGSYARTLEILDDARQIGLPLQVNTTITRLNVAQLDRMAALLSTRGIVLWSVFFLIPVGRGDQLSRISPEEYEAVFRRLWEHARRQPFAIKTTEAPHYRRFVLQQNGNPQRGPQSAAHSQRAPLGVNDGKGVMFVSHRGRIFPSGFLPLEAGRFPQESLVDIYQKSPLFSQLRDPDLLAGKCGLCEFRHACGGSRARAYALTGDPLAEEPDCVYIPRAVQEPAESPA